MPLVQIKNLTCSYPGAETPIFENLNLNLDTDWRLGLVGRNGRGKTTFLNLLLGKISGNGSIITSETFEYFPAVVQNTQQTARQVAREIIAPFDTWEQEMQCLTQQGTPQAIEKYGEVEQAYSACGGYTIDESIAAETGKLLLGSDILNRPYNSLSGGEQVKLMLAALFLKKHHFLLIDEPTDHLDASGRQTVAKWLATKSGFILVSHDRTFLDEAVNYIVSINRADIELQKGNYTTWRHNRTLQDNFEQAENKKLQTSIKRLKTAAERTEKWADKVEKSKKSGHKTYIHEIIKPDRGHIGHQAARMMQRSKAIVTRQSKEIEEKSKLLKNLEEAEAVTFQIIKPEKKKILTFENVAFGYNNKMLFENLDFTIEQGERVAIVGANGCGKSTLLHLITKQYAPTKGRIQMLSNLQISYLPQNTDFLKGNLMEFAAKRELDQTLLLAILRKLDFNRETFLQNMESYSAGQKKKVCLAASLAKPAHLFVWDEALNYIDVLSREQIEQAVLTSCPTMIFVEHDAMFMQNIALRKIEIPQVKASANN